MRIKSSSWPRHGPAADVYAKFFSLGSTRSLLEASPDALTQLPDWPEVDPEPSKVDAASGPKPTKLRPPSIENLDTSPTPPGIHFAVGDPTLEDEAYDDFPDLPPTPRERQESFGVFGVLPDEKTIRRQSSDAYRVLGRSPIRPPGHSSSQALRVRLLRVHAPQRNTGLPGDLANFYVLLRLGAQTARSPFLDNTQTGIQDNDFTFQLLDSVLQFEIMRVSALRDELHCKVPVALGRHNLVAGEWQRQKLPIPGAGEIEFELLLGHTMAEVAAQRGVEAKGTQKPDGSEDSMLEYQVGPRMFQPRANALPWEGVRVLELTRGTWTAALCGQMMAASGAEVIRVAFGEEALLARKQGSAPKRPLPRGANSLEQAQANQVPRQLHVGKRLAPLHPDDPEEMALLRSDLLNGCNVFLTDLPADELENMQLSAQTLRSSCPWLTYIHTSSIGMLADVTNKGVNDAGAFFCLSGMAEQLGHFLGPAGFAAAVSASALFGVACMAIMRRRCGSPGDRVELSIFRAGRWCAALGALTGWHKPQQPDVRFFVESDAKKQLATPFDVEGVAHIRPTSKQSAGPDKNYRWSVKDPSVLMPEVMPSSPISSELPLARVSVIEISDEYQISASAVGALLADLGARVTKLERPQRPDPWKRTCPQLYQDLTARKKISLVNYSGVGGVDAKGEPVPGQAALYRTLTKTTILLTNLPLAALEAWGLAPKKLQEMFPHLIILWITTWGYDEMARHKELAFGRKGGQEAHAFWEASGLCQSFNGNAIPPGLGELAVAQHALGGVGLALLRQQRTGGGQLVHVSRYRAGLYCQSISSIEPVMPLASPLLQTLDGRFLRLLGRGPSLKCVGTDRYQSVKDLTQSLLAGHQPHDAWVLLHAIGRRESLVKQAEGNWISILLIIWVPKDSWGFLF